VIGDRQIFVVVQQWLVGAEQAAGVGGVVDAGEEVGVVADPGGEVHDAVRGAVQQTAFEAAHGGGRVIGQQVEQADAQGGPGWGAEPHEHVKGIGGRGFGGGAVEHADIEAGFEIEDGFADGDTAARQLALAAEHAERQVLHRKVGMAARRRDPAGALGIVREVDQVPSSANRYTVYLGARGRKLLPTLQS
jgi:hypothetical protein